MRSLIVTAATAVALTSCASSARDASPSPSSVSLPSVPTYTSADNAESAVCQQYRSIIEKIGTNYDRTKFEGRAYALVKTAQQAQDLAGASDTYASQLYNASALLRQQIIKGQVETDLENGPAALLQQLCR